MPKIDIDPIDRHVAELLHSIRLARNVTQVELAEAIGISFQQLQKYERGLNRIPASRLWRFSVALAVPITDFYAGLDKTSDAPEAGSSAQTLFDSSVMQAALALSRITEAEKRKAIARALSILTDTPIELEDPELQNGAN